MLPAASDPGLGFTSARGAGVAVGISPPTATAPRPRAPVATRKASVNPSSEASAPRDPPGRWRRRGGAPSPVGPTTGTAPSRRCPWCKGTAEATGLPGCLPPDIGCSCRDRRAAAPPFTAAVTPSAYGSSHGCPRRALDAEEVRPMAGKNTVPVKRHKRSTPSDPTGLVRSSVEIPSTHGRHSQ